MPSRNLFSYTPQARKLTSVFAKKRRVYRRKSRRTAAQKRFFGWYFSSGPGRFVSRRRQ